MVWCCLSWNRLGPRIVCEPGSWGGGGGIGAEEYIELLSEGQLSFVDDLLCAEDQDTIRVKQPWDLIFMQDCTPCHMAPDTMRFLEESDLQSWQSV